MITQEEVEALADLYSQAILEGDVEAATALCTDDAIVLSRGEQVAKGRKEIAAMLAKWAVRARRSKGEKAQTLAFHCDGNLAWWAASYSEEFEDDKGSTEIETGKFIDVLQRQPNGSWKFQAACIYQD